MKPRIALFTPGPTNIEQEVLHSFQQEILHHRGKAFRQLYPLLCEKLKYVFQTKEGKTLALTASGTLGLDAGIASLLNPGEEVIVISNGYFGERLSMMATSYGLHVIEHKKSWGSPILIEEVTALVQSHPQVKALLVVHSETSTGNLQDLQALGKLTKQTNLLFIVDAISGLLFNEFFFDAWGIDYAVSSSQKGFGLPPGLCFVCLSPKAEARLKQRDVPYYLSLASYLHFAEEFGSTPSTPAVHMLQALDGVLDRIHQQGLLHYQQRGKAHIEQLKTALLPLGFSLFIQEATYQVGGVLTLLLPKNVDGTALQDYLLNHHQVLIEKGIGPLAKQAIRIGVMSEVTEEEIRRLIDGMNEYVYGL